MKKTLGLDRSGILISSLCIFHCTLLPLLLGLFPVLGLQWMVHNPVIHITFFVFMVLLASGAFALKYRRHLSFEPLYWMLSGIILVGLGHFVFMEHGGRNHHHHHHHMAQQDFISQISTQFTLSTWLALAGGVLLIVGHFKNRRLNSCCRI